MLRNHLKVAVRHIFRQKGYSFINIAGLAIGMACCILIMLWVQDELSFDKFHADADRIYLLGMAKELETGEQIFAAQQAPMGPLLKDSFPEVEEVTRFVQGMMTLRYGETASEEYIAFADPALLTMFTFPLVQGDSRTALSDPASIVLTKEAAAKFFGDMEPMGEVIRLNNQYDLRITGILEDVPDNSSLEFDVVVPFQFLKTLSNNIDEWAGSDYYTYLLLQEGVSSEDITAKIQTLGDDLDREWYSREDNPNRYFIYPFKWLHFFSIFGEAGLLQYVYIFAAAAIFILAIACINFINISTARSTKRAKEIGLRKVFGAKRSSLVRQLLAESTILALIAFILALTLAELLMPTFNSIARKALSIQFDNLWIVGGILLIGIFTGLLSGSFPALYISRFLPVKALEGRLRSGKSGFALRRILVIVQFSLSLILIIGTLVIGSQIRYLNNKDLGLNKENMVYFWATSNIKEHYHAFKQDLLQHHNISHVTGSAQNIFHINSTIGNNWDFDGRNTDQRIELHFDWVAADYAQTFDIEMAAGRFYTPAEFATDTVDGIVLNEKAVNLMGIENPIGKRFSYWGRDCRIIGVIKDFHLEPLYETLKPMILIYNNFNSVIYMRTAQQETSETLAFIEETFNKYEPGGTFNIRFLDESYEYMYRNEERLQTLFNWAAILAIFTACLGLFGLTSFTTEQRTREIGVRKVLGATITDVVALVSKESVILVLIANVIAWPVAYLVMQRWLENFAYRTGISLGLFGIAGLAALLIATLTVGLQTLKAASTNPIDTLRYE